MKQLLAAGLIAVALAAGAPAYASSPPFTTPTDLVVGQPATITVDNTVLSSKTFIVMPGVDFLPSNGSCYTRMRLPAGHVPSFVWVCQDRAAPIVFVSPSVATADLVPDTLHTWGTGLVGLVGTGGMSRGAWTLSSPPAKYDFQPAATL